MLTKSGESWCPCLVPDLEKISTCGLDGCGFVMLRFVPSPTSLSIFIMKGCVSNPFSASIETII